jgi:hypothetical protein
MVAPDSQASACLPSGRNSTYRPVQICGTGSAYTYLRGIWNDNLEPTHIRMRAAAIGIEFERPRLQVTAQIQDNDLATLLDQRLKRVAELEKGNGKVIDGPTPQVEVKPPMPRLADRRYRRF